MRVLHVSEAMGGGVTSAVTAMVEATPEVDHHLLARARPQHDTGVDPEGFFTSTHAMSRNPAVAVATLRALVRDLYPDVVHAHSSVAGVVTRLAGLDRTPVVYSPHCFAFERRDIGGAARRVFHAVERGLAPRTDLFLAVAPQELDLAADLGHRALAYVPNRARPHDAGTVPTTRAQFERRPHVVTVGRICAQKDWRYLVHLKRYVDENLGLDASWEWLGDGDPEGRRALQAAGITVSGWIDRSEVMTRLSEAQIYVHTAAWEAAPISIFEAADLGVPLAIRSIPSLASLDLPGLASGVADLGSRLTSLATEPGWSSARDASLALVERHSAATQGRHLLRAYDRVVSGSADAVTVMTPRVPALVGGSALRETGTGQ